MKRNICVISSSRADYNHLFVLMKKLQASRKLKLSVIVTGMHTLKEYGYTLKEIKEDGFKIDEVIKTHQLDTSKRSILLSMSEQLKKAYSSIQRIKPDLIVVLGDRYDMYPIVLTAHIMNIAIAHLHGGEVTSGVLDDGFRHSVSKLSHLHFVAHNDFKKRLIRMGEDKKNIYNVGSLGVDAINNLKFNSKKIILSKYKIPLDKKYLVICVHPETVQGNNKKLIQNILKSLKEFSNYHKVFTYPNSDTDSRIILNDIMKFVKKDNNSQIIKSSGRHDFLHLLKYSECLIGNSSSGIVECPILGTPSVNIGKRQNGRPRTSSILDTKSTVANITKNIFLAVKYQKKKLIPNYVGKNSVGRILEVLSSVNLESIVDKNFIDYKM